jgi:hypothetical protein
MLQLLVRFPLPNIADVEIGLGETIHLELNVPRAIQGCSHNFFGAFRHGLRHRLPTHEPLGHEVPKSALEFLPGVFGFHKHGPLLDEFVVGPVLPLLRFHKSVLQKKIQTICHMPLHGGLDIDVRKQDSSIVFYFFLLRLPQRQQLITPRPPIFVAFLNSSIFHCLSLLRSAVPTRFVLLLRPEMHLVKYKVVVVI